MTITKSDALDVIRGIGSPEELERAAAQGVTPRDRQKVNAHIHLPPNFSAFDSITQALDLAGAQAVRVLGASNYYNYDVYAEFAEGARRRGIFPLFGLEIIGLIDELVRSAVLINDPGNPGKIYICGKGITGFSHMTSAARHLLGQVREKDTARMRAITARLAQVLAERGLETGLNENAVIDMIVARHGSPRGTVYLQERHVAQAFQEAMFKLIPLEYRRERLDQLLGAPLKGAPDDHVAVQNEIRSQLLKSGKPAFVPETFVGYGEALRLILELGGIPCYPTLADGAKPVCPYEDSPEKLVETLRRDHIHAAEFIPIRNTHEVLERYVKTMRRAGLVITAGTEHNTLDLIPIEPTCKGGAPISDELREIFWEGACVVAAHQFLCVHGRTGYVDRDGNLNNQYGEGEARVNYFKRLGAAVIARYQEMYGCNNDN